jgi:uncharacterized protein YjaG (DUF416 family)
MASIPAPEEPFIVHYLIVPPYHACVHLHVHVHVYVCAQVHEQALELSLLLIISFSIVSGLVVCREWRALRNSSSPVLLRLEWP